MTTIYNFPYYPVHVERLGYVKDADWLEYLITVPPAIPDRVNRVARAALERSGLHVLQTRRRADLRPYIAEVFVPFPVSTMEVLRAELAPGAARRMTLAGRNMGPEQALADGVLDELQPPEQVLARAKQVALEFAALPREGYAKFKRQLREVALARMEEALRTGSDPLLELWIAEEGRAASAEHLERGGR